MTPSRVQFSCVRPASKRGFTPERAAECAPPLSFEACCAEVENARQLLRDAACSEKERAAVDASLGLAPRESGRGDSTHIKSLGVALAYTEVEEDGVLCERAAAAVTFWRRGNMAQVVIAATAAPLRCRGFMRFLIGALADRLEGLGVDTLVLETPRQPLLIYIFGKLGFAELGRWPRDGAQLNLWVEQHAPNNSVVWGRGLGSNVLEQAAARTPARAREITSSKKGGCGAAQKQAPRVPGPPPSWPYQDVAFLSGAITRGTPPEVFPQMHCPWVYVRRVTKQDHPCCGEYGLFAAFDIIMSPEDESVRLCSYGGFLERTRSGNSSRYIVALTSHPDIDVDAEHAGSEARFANDYHGVPGVKEANAVLLDDHDAVHGHLGLSLFLTKTVLAGEEIFVDYGDEYWESLRERGSYYGGSTSHTQSTEGATCNVAGAVVVCQMHVFF